MWQVLAVEDDPDIQQLIRASLRGVAEVRCVGTLAAAPGAISSVRPDLILLDVSLPDGEGYQLCSALQNADETHDIPIVFLTARGDPRDKVTAFRLGADDYVEKPFASEELRARVESRVEKLARRRQREHVTRLGRIRIDLERHRVSIEETAGAREVDLTAHELRLLHYLASRPGRIFSRDQLMRAVWSETVVAERTIDSHVSKLRKKLGEAGVQLRSVRGVGYVLDAG